LLYIKQNIDNYSCSQYAELHHDGWSIISTQSIKFTLLSITKQYNINMSQKPENWQLVTAQKTLQLSNRWL